MLRKDSHQFDCSERTGQKTERDLRLKKHRYINFCMEPADSCPRDLAGSKNGPIGEGTTGGNALPLQRWRYASLGCRHARRVRLAFPKQFNRHLK